LSPIIEKDIIDAGIVLVRFWLEVGEEEQKRRSTRKSRPRVRPPASEGQ
jgi:polyphosphate kinase 2 (PPK2 family)